MHQLPNNYATFIVKEGKGWKRRNPKLKNHGIKQNSHNLFIYFFISFLIPLL